jgi:hypothetical protein
MEVNLYYFEEDNNNNNNNHHQSVRNLAVELEEETLHIREIPG